MERLNKICHNVRIAFRKRDAEALNIHFKVLWNHILNVGWKVSANYSVEEDKYLLSRGIACSIQSFMFSESSQKGLELKQSFMTKAILELSHGFQFYTNNKYKKAECAYWMFFCICKNIFILQKLMENTLTGLRKTINKENMSIIPFLILHHLHEFCIEKDYSDMTYTPLFDEKNGLDERGFSQLLIQYQDAAIPLLENAANNPNVEFDIKSLQQESQQAYECFLNNIKLEESSSVYKSIMKY